MDSAAAKADMSTTQWGKDVPTNPVTPNNNRNTIRKYVLMVWYRFS